MTQEQKQQTIDTYNRSARALADYFAGIGARTDDIDRAFSYFPSEKHASLNILEIGCGDGRDAQEIVKRSPHYHGMDISQEMIQIAQERLPQASFSIADIDTYELPPNIDIIFAFASLLHSDKESVAAILKRAHKSLNPQAIFYISLKRAPYQAKDKVDTHGIRTFYFYEPSDIEHLAGDLYETKFIDYTTIGHTDWFEIVLQKK